MSSSSTATVFIPDPFHPDAEAYAEKRFSSVLRTGHGLDRSACLAASDGILLRVGSISAADLDLAPKLKITSRNGTGCDTIDLEACRQRGVVVTNHPGGNAQSVAELALTLMLVCLRRVKELDARIRAGEIVPSICALGTGLHRRTIGLIGMGATAYELAKLLVPFECRILVWSPTSPFERWSGVDPRFPAQIEHHRTDELKKMLEQVDVVSLHCPITPVTRGLIGEAELRAMKPTAILINTARGGIVDEKALAVSLKEDQLGGAGLDVFAVEPAHGETMGELGKMDNVVCLPHIGGSTDEVTRKGCMRAVDIMADFLDGKGAVNRVV